MDACLCSTAFERYVQPMPWATTPAARHVGHVQARARVFTELEAPWATWKLQLPTLNRPRNACEATPDNEEHVPYNEDHAPQRGRSTSMMQKNYVEKFSVPSPDPWSFGLSQCRAFGSVCGASRKFEADPCKPNRCVKYPRQSMNGRGGAPYSSAR